MVLFTQDDNPVLIFGDETYPDRTGGRRISYVTVAVRRQDLSNLCSELEDIRAQNGKRQVRKLRELLGSPVFKLLVLDVDRLGLHSDGFFGIRDEYPDIGSVSRVDEIWCQAFGYSIAAILPTLVEIWGESRFQVYYDRKDLAKPLRDSTHESLVQKLSSLANEGFWENSRKHVCRLEKVQEISKPINDGYDLFQNGTWLADRVGYLVTQFNRRDLSFDVEFLDATELVKEIESIKRSPGEGLKWEGVTSPSHGGAE